MKSLFWASILFGIDLSRSTTTSSSEHEYGDLLSNSCVGKEDGEHWLLLSSDKPNDYMPVKLECSNEYVILDVNKDSNLKNYFSTFYKWHYAIGGPANSDAVNWEEWFLPENSENNENAKYYISPDCSSCDISHARQVFDDNTAYYMTGNLAKMFWGVIGFNECDFDTETYQCYDCTTCLASILDASVVCNAVPFNEEATDYSSAGICGVAVQSSDMEVSKTRKEAYTGATHYKPSIGTDGRFCMCYQPSVDDLNEYSLTETQENHIETIMMKNEEISDKNKNENNEKNEGNEGDSKIKSYIAIDGGSNTLKSTDKRASNIVYLSQKDFEHGTFKILESGTYIITENIVFDFNSNDDYWPRSDQSHIYPGASCVSPTGETACRDAYHLGFFAGITIETDYVTIDLNGNELEMSLPFYYQQRWFAIIELGNQLFLPGQGPAFFGPDAVSVSDITIKNGILGRTSHFAIHGNYPEYLTIEDVHIKDFVTHGLQINGWTNLEMNNIEIGPSSHIEYLRGEYGHARILIQRLQWISEQLEDAGTLETNTLEFGTSHWSNYYGTYNEESGKTIVTLTDIIDELELQMEMAYNYAINRANGGIYYTNDFIDPKYTSDTEGKERWIAAKSQFIQESGIPSASSITGLFLNFMGASVFSYAKITTHKSSHGKLNNIYIHDIVHDMVESIRFTTTSDSGQTYPTPWNSDIPAEQAFGNKDKLVDFRSIVTADTIDESELSNNLYVGSILTDVYLAMGTFSDDWNYLGFLQIGDNKDYAFSKWAQNEDIAKDSWRFGCNQDIMGHSGKGLIGLRLDGVSDLELNNIRIENLKSKSQLGTMACGEYDGMAAHGEGGHFKQSSPMQIGFSGNNIQGLSIISSDVSLGNIKVSNVESDYGEGYGISLWTANDITVKKDAFIVVSGLNTGMEVNNNNNDDYSLTYESYPNRSPEACGFRMEVDDASDMYDSSITFESGNHENNIVVCGITGSEVCLGNTNELNQLTMYGSYLSDNSNLCNSIQNTDDLVEYLDKNSVDSDVEEKSASVTHRLMKHSKLSADDDLLALAYMIALLLVTSVITFATFMCCNKFLCKPPQNSKEMKHCYKDGYYYNNIDTPRITTAHYGTI